MITEGNEVAQAAFRHLDVALLEDLERQQPTGKQHGSQRKQRQCPGLAVLAR